MTATRTIRPAEDRRVRHPETRQLLAAEGEPVTWNSYWERLHQAKDVVWDEEEEKAHLDAQAAAVRQAEVDAAARVKAATRAAPPAASPSTVKEA